MIEMFVFAEQLRAIPDFANLGNLFKSSSLPVELTESETEYVVQCIKHTFGRYMVFQVKLEPLLFYHICENKPLVNCLFEKCVCLFC